jgi:adenylate cyclase
VGGAEVDIAVLFADVRGSTALGQSSVAADFAALLNRFYIAATHTLLRHDAVIDKLIGDQVMAFFVPGISGPNYRRRAVQAGMELLEAVGYGSDEWPWIDVGIAVNAAARMQQKAAGGELLVASGVADDLMSETPRRTLDLRGHQQPINAFALGRWSDNQRREVIASSA